MRLADLAWREVDTTTIRNCWRKTGILPEISETGLPATPTVPISSLLADNTLSPSQPEVELTEGLTVLEGRGVLQRRNCLSIEELLNPMHEDQIISADITDESIAESVRAKHAAFQSMETNGGDDPDDLGDEVMEVKPSRREALAASMTLQRFVANMDDPFARRLEALLANFGRQTRFEESIALRSSRITDYFTSSSS